MDAIQAFRTLCCRAGARSLTRLLNALETRTIPASSLVCPPGVGGGGCAIADKIAQCAANASNHGQFVSCVAQLTNELKQTGIITNQQKGAIQKCAAHASIP